MCPISSIKCCIHIEWTVCGSKVGRWREDFANEIRSLRWGVSRADRDLVNQMKSMALSTYAAMRMQVCVKKWYSAVFVLPSQGVQSRLQIITGRRRMRIADSLS